MYQQQHQQALFLTEVYGLEADTMSGISKRVSGSWVSGDYGIMGTSTDTITTLPADIYANDTTATVGISGNMEQNGTPTPDNPIMPQECGERTGNLFDIDNAIKNYYLKNGVPTQFNAGRYVLSDYIPIASDTATISAKITISSYFGAHWAVYDENKTFIRGGIAFDAYGSGIKVIDVDTSGAAFIRVDYSVQYLTDCMLNLGSTPLPYEPYGYKIPISSANTTTPIYLGEVETTRKIKKLVLTGEENFIRKDRPDTASYLYVLQLDHKNTIGVCSHLPYTSSYPRTFPGFRTDASMRYMYMCIGPELQEAQPGGNTVEGFRYYLAAQYAAGTPVTVWYVLANEETGIVNEPLMKIGGYADTLSNVSIPVTAGGDTISVGTTLQPSEATVNYKGWHPASVKEYHFDKTISDLEDMTISQMQTYTIISLQGGNWS